MAEPIRGQVARILTSRELVINRGSEHGVEVGMRFAILDPKAENVKDPETGEVLGSIFKPKVTVEVTKVEGRLSLAATYRKKRINVGGIGAGLTTFGKLFDPPEYIDEYETFKTSDQTWEELSEAESIVKVGDPVVLITKRQQELQTQMGSAAAVITSDGGHARDESTVIKTDEPAQSELEQPER